MRQLRDSLNSHSIGDSTECFRFTTGTGDQSGSLAGSVRSEDTVGSVVVRIRIFPDNQDPIAANR